MNIMRQWCVIQLAQMIDEKCGWISGNGVESCFSEGTIKLLPFDESTNPLAYSVAQILDNYKPEEHENFLKDVSRILDDNLNLLTLSRNEVLSFEMPSKNFPPLIQVYTGSPHWEDLEFLLEDRVKNKPIWVYDASKDVYLPATIAVSTLTTPPPIESGGIPIIVIHQELMANNPSKAKA